MSAPISNEIRRLIMRAKEAGKTVKEIVETFCVKTATVYNLFLHVAKTGSYEPLPNPNGRKPALTQQQLEAISQRIEQQPDITLQKLIDELKLPVCVSALCRIVKDKLGFVRKKNSSSVRTRTRRCARKAKCSETSAT